MPDFAQLFEIADRYFCDKGLRGPSAKWSANNYVDVYQAYLHARRKEPLRLLEIGLGVTGERWNAKIVHGGNAGGGASVKMWAEYLPNASITGVDINEASFLDTDRIKTYVVDQGSREDLAAFLSRHPDPHFDIIIDDGSHRADHQQISLEMLFPSLKSGGYYFIEDLNDFGFGGRSGGPHATPDTISTRELMRKYIQTGEIAGPNAFRSTMFFDQIVDIMFHCPLPRMRMRDVAIEGVRTALGKSGRGLYRREFATDSHMIVALQKA